MDCKRLFAPGGLIARRMSRYEVRPQQLEMAAAVSRAFERGEHLLVEAGTGVGKTFAYLAAAIDRIAEHNQRVVISTHTIALQEQLINKDIPFLAAIMPQEFSAVLVKGRGNYLGRRRLDRTRQRRSLLFDQGRSLAEVQRIAEWSDRTDDGSLADLGFRPSAEVWDQVRSEQGNCMGRRCSEYGRCFYQRARRRARHANLLVVNHALFFADLAVRQRGSSLLPDYDLAVLDEAHTIEEVAGAHLGMSVSDAQVRFLLDRLYNDGTKRGLLASCHAEAAVRTVARVRAVADGFFEALTVWQETRGRANGRLIAPPPVKNTLSDALRSLADHLKALRRQTTDESDRFEINAYLERAMVLASEIEHLLKQNSSDW
ncbi:MAG: DEAD/DEAH box helicase, partial [Planctomycetes bacterium]|nr:DEAD/DEAH box helicase [Planctomycetota bacterium]